MRIRHIALGIGLLVVPHLAWGQDATVVLSGHAFALQLPPHFARVNADTAAMDAMYLAPLRSDGTQGRILVQLIDMTAMPDSARPTLDAWASQMLSEQRQQDGWQEQDSDVQIDGVPARQIQWSEPAGRFPDRPQDVRRLCGTMILGFKGNMAFALHALDGQPHSDTTLAIDDRALRTFRLIRRQ